MRSRLAGLRRPFHGLAAVVVDGDDPWSPQQVISTDGNRWSRAGQPTVYLAGDPGVALAEAGRHLVVGDPLRAASLWQVRLDVDDAVDVRQRAVADVLEIPDESAWILDRERCRRIADATRAVGVSALIVPSAAFLDDLQRFDLVLFAECLTGGPDTVLTEPRRVAKLAPEVVPASSARAADAGI